MLNITGHADLLATIEAQRREIERLESACESAVVEIDRLRRQLEVHQSANPALLGALERAGADPVDFGDSR
jgi:hypothetical protein